MYRDINLLSESDKSEIRRLLTYSNHDPLQLEDMWQLMDIIWDEIGCDNNKIDKGKLSEFYSNPVWILNGIFTENHELSLRNRKAISYFIKERGLTKIIDFGGGWGTLARIIAKDNPEASVDIYDEFPTEHAIEKCKDLKNVKFIQTLKKNNYDCLVCTDVMEHVTDPLKLLEEAISLVKVRGHLIIGNNFYPVIKCHLPSNFHFRYTFRLFARIMGLKKIDNCVYAEVYIKLIENPSNWQFLRICERLSILLFPVLEIYFNLKKKVRNIIR